LFRPGHVRRAAGAHHAVELLASDTRLRRLDGGDDVRLAHIAARPRPHLIPAHLESLRRQPADSLYLLRLARLAGLVQPPPQPPIGKGKAVAEEMRVDQPAAWLILDRQLDAGNDPEGASLEAAQSVNPRQRVVFSQRNGAEAGCRRGVGAP